MNVFIEEHQDGVDVNHAVSEHELSCGVIEPVEINGTPYVTISLVTDTVEYEGGKSSGGEITQKGGIR